MSNKSIFNDDQRLKLQEMIKANDAEDFTEQIRKNREMLNARTRCSNACKWQTSLR